MKDPLDPGTIEFPAFYNQELINAVNSLESICTVEGTPANRYLQMQVANMTGSGASLDDKLTMLVGLINKLDKRIDELESRTISLLRQIATPSENL